MSDEWLKTYLKSMEANWQRDIKELKADVKLLLAEKNRRKGINLVIAAAVSTLVSLLIAYFERK